MVRCLCYPDDGDPRQGSRCAGCPKRAVGRGVAAFLLLVLACGGCAATRVVTPDGTSVQHITLLRRAAVVTKDVAVDHKAMSVELGGTTRDVAVGAVAGGLLGGPVGGAGGAAIGAGGLFEAARRVLNGEDAPAEDPAP